MAATCGSTCSWTFSPHTRTGMGRRGALAADMVVLPSWLVDAGGSWCLLLDGATADAGGDESLGEDEQEDRRDGAEHGGCHHRAPVGDVCPEIGVDAERDRDDLALRGQGQGVDEVRPTEDEGEEADGDQGVPADRHDDGEKSAYQSRPVDP